MTASESLLLSQLGVSYLPWAMISTASLTVASSLLYAHQLGRHPPGKLLGGSLWVIVTLVCCAWVLLQAGMPGLGLPLVALYGASFSLLASQSFGLASECLDSYASKRVMPILAVACGLGELAAGLWVTASGKSVGPETWLIAWALTSALAALWLHHQRHKLQRWREEYSGVPSPRPLSTRTALDYVKRAPMARALAWLLASMVVAQGISQYLFSQAFCQRYPEPAALSFFLGQLVLYANLARLGIGLFLTPRLLALLGVARSSWIQPLAMGLAALWLYAEPGLAAAIALWFSRRTLQDCLGAPVRNLLYNAISARLRARVRAFLDGAVVATAQATTGAMLLLLQAALSLGHLQFLAVILIGLYLLATGQASRQYLRSLAGELSSYRVRLGGPQVESTEGETVPAIGLDERLEALRAYPKDCEPLLRSRLAEALSDPHPRVRRLARQRLAEQGERAISTLLPLLTSDQPRTLSETLRCLSQIGGPWAQSLLRQQLRIQIENACRCWLAEYYLAPQDPFLRLALRDSQARGKKWALEILAYLEEPEMVAGLKLGLQSRFPSLRGQALEVLSQLGERKTAQAFLSLLEPQSPEEREVALRPLWNGGQEPDSWMAWCTHHSDPWIRWAGLRVLEGYSPAQRLRSQQLMRLQRCPLLSELSLDLLEEVRLQGREERFPAGFQLWQKGEPVQRCYFVLAGQLSRQEELQGLFEVLEGGGARWGVECLTACRTFSLGHSSWNSLMESSPACSLRVFAWLSSQLRDLEHRLKLE